jgi:hypothetical protein
MDNIGHAGLLKLRTSCAWSKLSASQAKGGPFQSVEYPLLTRIY